VTSLRCRASVVVMRAFVAVVVGLPLGIGSASLVSSSAASAAVTTTLAVAAGGTGTVSSGCLPSAPCRTIQDAIDVDKGRRSALTR